MISTHHQNQSHRARGARVFPCDLGPEDVLQACSDPVPFGFGPLFDVLTSETGRGLRAPVFFTSSHPHVGSSPDTLRCHGRQVERIAPCRFRVPVNSNREHQFGRQALADRSPSHFVAFRGRWSSMTNHHPRGFQSAGNIFQKGREENDR